MRLFCFDDGMNSPNTFLEICTASVSDVLIAEQAGADRVELNTALTLGGLTPSPGMVELALEKSHLPVIAMVRPRESGFCYSESEFDTLLRDVRWLVEAGISGIAFGVLTEQGTVDVPRCQAVIEATTGQQDIVFHRAFDLVSDMTQGLQTLIDCGVHRVMTSGGKRTAWEGRHQIAQLQKQSAGQIEILAAGGIRVNHVSDLIKETGVQQIHAGLGGPHWDRSYQKDTQVNFYGDPPENPAEYRESSPKRILQMAQTLKSMSK